MLKKADGFDDAIIGVSVCTAWPDRLAYSREKCINILMTRDGMSFKDAEDFFEVNVAGAYVGADTPCFIEDYVEEDLG